MIATILGKAGLANLQTRVADARVRMAEVLSEMELPDLPSRNDLVRRARAMMPSNAQSIEEIGARPPAPSRGGRLAPDRLGDTRLFARLRSPIRSFG